jgi:hypothetical protein
VAKLRRGEPSKLAVAESMVRRVASKAALWAVGGMPRTLCFSC